MRTDKHFKDCAIRRGHACDCGIDPRDINPPPRIREYHNYLRTTGTRTVTFRYDDQWRIEWSGKFDPATGTTVLTGRRIDPFAIDRWADDGGRNP